MKNALVIALLATHYVFNAFASEVFKQHPADPTKSTIPSVPKLLEPQPLQQVSNTEVTLKWEASPTAEKYNLQVSTNPMFYEMLVNDHNVTGTEYKLNQLEAGKTYYWRVSAVKSTNMPGTTKSNFSQSTFETK